MNTFVLPHIHAYRQYRHKITARASSAFIQTKKKMINDIKESLLICLGMIL